MPRAAGISAAQIGREGMGMPTRQQLLQVIHIQTALVKLGLDLGGAMQFIVEQTLALIAADGAAIELAEDGMMVYRAAAGIASAQLGLRLRIDNSLSGLSVLTGETLNCKDAEIDRRVDKLACRAVGLRSMIVMPLKFDGLTVGVLKAMAREPGRFKQSDIRLLGLLSEIVAAVMYHTAKLDSHELFIKATQDAMTGLANRALFMDRLRETVARSGRTQAASGVLMVDMDGLKQINDTYGHRIGDAVIVEFSSRLKHVTRSSDTAARLGGDEFGLILTPLETPEGVQTAIQRIESAMAQPFEFEERHYPLKASIGAALVPQDGQEPEKVLELADQRMYAVKRGQRSASRAH